MKDLNVSLLLKTQRNSGNLAYEYNPLRNLRSQEPVFYNDGKYVSILEIYDLLKIKDNPYCRFNLEVSDELSKHVDYILGMCQNSKSIAEILEYMQDKNLTPSFEVVSILVSEFYSLLRNSKFVEDGRVFILNDSLYYLPLGVANLNSTNTKYFETIEETPPLSPFLGLLIEAGSLIDFSTKLLAFDVNHPVQMIPQYSYDGSVNLIINDGKTSPRLINSGFSAIGKSKYEIINRKGNSNIYSLGDSFENTISLYKTSQSIVKIDYLGDSFGGNLSVGSYHFYFKLEDSDGNQTDFIGESGLVLIFKGRVPKEIDGGFRNESSNKLISFNISNIDSAYEYLRIYYTLLTSDIHENPICSAYVIDQKFPVKANRNCYINITGNEPFTQISIDDINAQLQIYEAVLTLEIAKNILFFGNLSKSELHYNDLKNLSLHFLPSIDCSVNTDYDKLDEEYYIPANYENTYYDSKFIYNFTGYWAEEIYRFGIVYIYNDDSLSPVFNIRGRKDLGKTLEYTNLDVINSAGDIININYNEETYLLDEDNSAAILENVKGVVQFNAAATNKEVIGITFNTNAVVLEMLKLRNIKGFFFVRLKRIPTLLCLAFVIGVDQSESYTPLIPVGDRYVYESLVDSNSVLELDFNPRLRYISQAFANAALCPEYDINYPYYNSLFNGSEYTLRTSLYLNSLKGFTQSATDSRHFYVKPIVSNSTRNIKSSKVLGVEDNVKLLAIDGLKFRSRAGEAEDISIEFISEDLRRNSPNNIVRGSYGPYLAFGTSHLSGTYVDIMIPNYSSDKMKEYFNSRYLDNSSYYPISDRLSLSEVSTVMGPFYRGDCFICLVTHRFNRNFNDITAPTNDLIVDKNTYKDGFKYKDGTYKQDDEKPINIGDLNAVKLGMWTTLQIRSSINLNIRSLDSSNVESDVLMGHPRGFYPLQAKLVDGNYKTPEALCYNSGYSKLLSQKNNMILPDVPTFYNNYSNRIAYSNVQIDRMFVNNLRIFKAGLYRDYTNKYGRIIKLVNVNDDLLCICEHGILLLNINEKILVNGSLGENLHINTNNVLPETPVVISDTYGSLWAESIIKTDSGVYGVDTVAKKIWKVVGQTFECISDGRVLEYLNNNITLSERETEPIVGIRNIKTHYNKFKNDIIFTYYDDLYGLEEKVWSMCYNETLGIWTTFYSWVPSYSDNIHNQFFSFDRNTSKYIAKLGICKQGSGFESGIVLSNNIIENDLNIDRPLTKQDILRDPSLGFIGYLDLVNRNLPEGKDLEVIKSFELVRDNFLNQNNFYIHTHSDGRQSLHLLSPAIDYCIEQYLKGTFTTSQGVITYTPKITDLGDKNQYKDWVNNCVLRSEYVTCKDDLGRKKRLENNNRLPIIFLNILCNLKVVYKNSDMTFEEILANGFKNDYTLDAGMYKNTITLIPLYNLLFLTSDFWKHGLSGIIDILEPINPTMWYGQLHPFEFEFVVSDKIDKHKIFNNLEIISNNAEPDSFHYEIIGDSYDFADDKKNMYIRLEATKELYQYNGSNITFDNSYYKLESKHRPINSSETLFERSTILPLYYKRVGTVDNIYDTYVSMNSPSNRDYSWLSGGEVRYNNTTKEYSLINHSKAVNMNTGGLLRGNMLYLGDKWEIQINPLNIVQYNEPSWKDTIIPGSENLVPVEIGQNPTPDEILSLDHELELPESFCVKGKERGITVWNPDDTSQEYAKLRDKYIKIKIVYKGDKLAIIHAINTLYSIIL